MMFESLTILDHRTHNQSEHVMFAKIRYEIVKCCFSIVIHLDALRLSCQWSQGFADAQNYGKPPVESARAIEDVGGLNGVIREGTILCSDGARCYPKLCRTRKIKHFCCSHRQSQFNVKKNGRERQLMSTRARLTMFGG